MIQQSPPTFITFLTQTKEGDEERKRLSLLPSSLVLVRNVFSGNPFKIVSIVGLDGSKSHLWFLMEKKAGGLVTKIFTRFHRVFPSELSHGLKDLLMIS